MASSSAARASVNASSQFIGPLTPWSASGGMPAGHSGTQSTKFHPRGAVSSPSAFRLGRKLSMTARTPGIRPRTNAPSSRQCA